MLLKGLAAALLLGSLFGQVSGTRRRRRGGRAVGRWERLFNEPRSAVLLVLFSVLILGGGRKLLQARRARAAVGQLDDSTVTPEALTAVADHGRAGLMELFRVLGSSEKPELREAAGHAVSILWARDELIAEEEKALVRRGYEVRWKARRRYPRGLRSTIPISVAYGVPFLREGGAGVGPANLEWSHRVVGARRASLEVFSPWVAGKPHAAIDLVPADFETDGPHKLVLQTRVRTVGLTESWELELPHVPFSFEFDPKLAVEALFALPDESRAEAFSRAVRLGVRPTVFKSAEPFEAAREPTSDPSLDFVIDPIRRGDRSAGPGLEDEVPTFFRLNDGLAIRDVPAIEVTTPVPCDLAHSVEVEFEGVPGRFAAGELILSEGLAAVEPNRAVKFPLGPMSPVPPGAIERPGTRPMRVRLAPDPDLGWADPDVRSIWPEPIVTDWVDVEIVRC